MGKFTTSFLTHTSEIEVADFRRRLNRSLNSSQDSAESCLGEQVYRLAWSCLHCSEPFDGGNVVEITQLPPIVDGLIIVVDLQHCILARQQWVNSTFNVSKTLFTNELISPHNSAGRESLRLPVFLIKEPKWGF